MESEKEWWRVAQCGRECESTDIQQVFRCLVRVACCVYQMPSKGGMLCIRIGAPLQQRVVQALGLSKDCTV